MFVISNLGRIDRLIRLATGALLIAAPYVLADAALWELPAARWGIPVAGSVLMLTAILRCCPLYRLFGISSCRIG